MKTVYLDSDFKCHVDPILGGMTYETDFFDNKSDVFINGYRIVPEGWSWLRSDGVVFSGLMISPAVNSNYLTGAQTQFEEDNKNMMALDDVAELVEMVYLDDLGVIG